MKAGDLVTLEELGGERFVVGRILAGGMGAVYELFPIHAPGSAYALKTYGAVADEGLFMAEAAAWLRLSGHPNIALARWYGRWQGQPAIFADWYDGTVSHELALTLSDARLTEVFFEVVDALDYAWREELILHRDIKPDNILWDEGGRPRLADFGLAISAKRQLISSVEDVTSLLRSPISLGRVAGTPPYMAPELFSGAQASIRTDLYALGVTLFEWLTGEYPFMGPETGYQFRPVLRRSALARIPSSRRDLFAPLVERLLSVDPSQRPPSYSALRDILPWQAYHGREIRSPSDIVAEAAFLRKEGHVAGAERLLRDAIARHGGDPLLFNALAIAVAADDRTNERVNLLEQATVLLEAVGGLLDGVPYPDPVVNLANEWLRRNDFHEVARLLAMARLWTGQDTYSRLYYCEFGWLQLWEGDFESACDYLGDVLSRRLITETHPLEWFLLAAWLADGSDRWAPVIARNLPRPLLTIAHGLITSVLAAWLPSSANTLISEIPSAMLEEVDGVLRAAGVSFDELVRLKSERAIAVIMGALDERWTGRRFTAG